MKRSKCGFCLLLNYKCLFSCWKKKLGTKLSFFFELCQDNNKQWRVFWRLQLFLAQKKSKNCGNQKKFFFLFPPFQNFLYPRGLCKTTNLKTLESSNLSTKLFFFSRLIFLLQFPCWVWLSHFRLMLEYLLQFTSKDNMWKV
jgi:hypothetical protein